MQKRDEWVDCVYLDFKKGSDRVSYQRVFWKLEYKGGNEGILLNWMFDFLVARKVRIMIRGEQSTWREVISGVLWGSVLTPIMFLL